MKSNVDPTIGEKIRAKLSDHPIRVEKSYIADQSDEVYRIPLGDFLKDYEWFAERGLMCPETLAPELGDEILDGLREAAGTDDEQPTAIIHVGYPGSSSPIHFDWDFRTVFHVNLTGDKTFATAAPDSGFAMPTLINSIPFDLSAFTEPKQTTLLGLIDAETTRLSAGEGVSFPPLWWHAALYREPSLSLSFRFDELRELRPIAALPRSAELQRLAWLLHVHRGELTVDPIARVIEAFIAIEGDWEARHTDFLEAVRSIDVECREQLGLTIPVYGYPAHLQGVPKHVAVELAQSYSLPFGRDEQLVEENAIEVVRSYIFDTGCDGISDELQWSLARYANSVRNTRLC